MFKPLKVDVTAKPIKPPRKRPRRVRSPSRKARSRASSKAHREKLEAENVPEREIFAAVHFDLLVSRLADGSPDAISAAKDVMRELSKNYDCKATFRRLQGMVAREKAGRQRPGADMPA